MAQKVHGIHHVTAISGDPQASVDFYVGVLGLRLVKKTVNFDDPFTYHLYYGDEVGEPGTILTFFPWGNRGLRGRQGPGQVTVTGFSIPENSVGFWIDRLKEKDVPFKGPLTRFEQEIITLHDVDGLELELVATSDDRPGWRQGPVPAEHAIRGFYGVALSVEGYERTAGLLTTTLGFRQVQESGNRFRYEADAGGPGTVVDLLCLPDAPHGTIGVGTVHHVAWRAHDEEEQVALRKELVRLGYNVTPVINRHYFRSIYFREPGNVLFEIATDPPGFAIDEGAAGLGSKLTLPPWLESERAAIEKHLPPIEVPEW